MTEDAGQIFTGLINEYQSRKDLRHTDPNAHLETKIPAELPRAANLGVMCLGPGGRLFITALGDSGNVVWVEC